MAVYEVTRIRVVCDVCGNDYEFDSQAEADHFLKTAKWIKEDGLLLCLPKHHWIPNEEQEKAELRAELQRG